MSLQLPELFKQDIQGKDTQLFPVVIISNYKEQAGGNFAFVGDKHFISTNVWTDPTFNNVYKPILLNIPSLKESLDVQSRKYKISSVNLDISNYEYNGERFSDSVASSLINTEVRIFWVSPSVRRVVLYDQDQSEPDAAFQVFYGHIRKYEHDDEKVRLTVEDRSQIVLHKDLPLAENYIGSGEGVLNQYKNKPIPIVYGYVDKSPCVVDVNNIIKIDVRPIQELVKNNNDGFNEEVSPLLINKDDIYLPVVDKVVEDLGTIEELDLGESLNTEYNLQGDDIELETSVNENDIIWAQNGDNSPEIIIKPHILTNNNILQCKYFYKPSSISIGRYDMEDYTINLLSQEQGKALIDNLYEGINFDSGIIERLHNVSAGYNYDRIDFHRIYSKFTISTNPTMGDILNFRVKNIALNKVLLPIPTQVEGYNSTWTNRLFVYPSTTYDERLMAGNPMTLSHLGLNGLFGFPDEDGNNGYNYETSDIDIRYSGSCVGCNGGHIHVPSIWIYDNSGMGSNIQNGTYEMFFMGLSQFAWTGNNATEEGDNYGGELSIGDSGDFEEVDIKAIVDIEKAFSNPFYVNVKGRYIAEGLGLAESIANNMNNMYSRNIGLIMRHLFMHELNYNALLENMFVNMDYNDYNIWNFDFTIADKINSKKLIENLSSIAPFVTRFDNMGNLKLNEIPKDGGTAEHTILQSDVVDMNFTRTPIDEVYTKIEFKYNWDYATNEFTKRRILDMDNFVCWGYNNEGNYEAYNYDYYGFDYVTEDGEQIGSHKDTTLVVDDDRGKYIRDDATAERFCSWMLSWYGQQHLIIKLKLPLKYLNLEIGDIIDFDSLIGGIKPYGIDYTQDASGEENVVQQYQTFYKNFQIISTNKNLDFVEISAIQLHETWAVNANENGGVVDDVMVALNQGSNPGCSPLTGCMNINACNYNPDATAPSNCIFPEFWCEDLDGSGQGNFPPYPVCDDIYADTMPDGTLTKSEADQQGIINDCSDDCVGEYDCAGECGGSAEFDECGVCGGNNDCVDCAGVPNGDSFMDNCGLDCLPNEEPFHPDYFLDCAGLCPDDPDHNGLYDGGGLDECGVCNGEGNTCDVNLNYQSQKLEYPNLPPYFNTYPSNNDYFANCLDTYNPNCNAVNIENRIQFTLPNINSIPTFRISGNYLDGDNPAISGYFKYEIAITRTVYIGINDPVAQTSVCEEIYRKEETYNFNNIASEQLISFEDFDPDLDLFKDANLGGGTSSVLDSSTEFFAEYQIFYEITEFVIESGYDVGNFNSVTFTNGGEEGIVGKEFSFYHFPYFTDESCQGLAGDVDNNGAIDIDDFAAVFYGYYTNWGSLFGYPPAPLIEEDADEGTWNGNTFWWCRAAKLTEPLDEITTTDIALLSDLYQSSFSSNTSNIKTSDVQLLYGNGECEIIGKDITYCHMIIENPITVDDKTPEGYYVMGNNNNIKIMPMKQVSQSLNTLFEYEGELVIKNAFAISPSGERINCKIKRVMDYAELLNTNAEDMTTLSENLKSKKLYGKKINKTIFKQNIIDDLDASAGAFYLKDGSEYSGKFHIHIDTTQRMSGATHTEESENLYFKDSINGNVIDKLILANNSNYLNRQSMKLNSRSNTHRRKRTYATNS